MARKNQDILDRLIGNLSLRGLLFHPATLFVAATGGLIAGAILLWEAQSGTIVNLEEFQLTQEKIRLTEPPEWAETNLKEILTSQPSGDAPSILDSELVSRTANVMRNVGYVRARPKCPEIQKWFGYRCHLSLSGRIG